jgi:hypothetical protein
MDDDSIKPITNQGFFAYVFKLSKFKQQDLLNITQYLAITILPVILFLYFTKKYFPSISHEDSSLYIFILTFIELIFMIVGIFFIDRIINYIPTYSGKYYETINLTTIIIVFVLIMLLTEAGFRERVAILLYRFDNWFIYDDMLMRKLGFEPKPFSLLKSEQGQFNLEAGRVSGEGRPDVDQATVKKGKNKSKGKNGVVSTQQATINPQMSQQYAVPPPLPVQGPSSANYGGGGGGGGGGMSSAVQNFNSMYAGPVNPLVNATSSTMDDSFMEPMAANSVLGGGCWGSSW